MRRIGIILLAVLVFTGCSGKKSENSIYALIVSKEGKIVEETYFNGKTKNDLVNVQSVTKSIISFLIGIAIDEGHIENENVPIHTFFPEDSVLFDNNKKQITIKHLLNHTSGLSWNGYQEHDSFLKSQDPLKFVMGKALLDTPGRTYNYNSGGTHLLSAILEKATGKTTLQFANEKLFGPLEILTLDWEKLNDGVYDGAGFGLSMKPVDLVKIGELLLNNGVFNGTNVLSKKWIDQSKRDREKQATHWGIKNSKHGYGWYLAMLNDKTVFYAMGYGGQFIFVIPSENMVIVATHNSDTPNGIDQQVDFIKNSLPELLHKYNSR